MAVVDYSLNFWGDRHIGYHVLHENLKKGEDSVQELGAFIKERMSIEDDLLKFLNKSLNRVNNYVTTNGAFVDSWRLTKGTLELWLEIQASLMKNLSDLSKEIIKYHDELVKSRKRAKEYDVLDAVNLMQTTTTCLQKVNFLLGIKKNIKNKNKELFKAKETYHQRCAEMMNLKNESLGSNNKELLKAKTKLNKAHEEYKSYVERYNKVRETFEEKMLKATKAFQDHDSAHLNQMKKFFVVYAQSLDDSSAAVSQVVADYRQNLEVLDTTAIMQRFVQEKGTGMEKPQPIVWTEADEIPAELEVLTADNTVGSGGTASLFGGSSQSAPGSSNSSAVVSIPNHADPSIATVNDLLDIGESWTGGSVSHNSRGLDSKSCDSDSGSELGSSVAGGIGSGGANATTSATHSSSYVPQFSSWLGRQKLTQWRKKHSASQSNLPAAVANEFTNADFGASQQGNGNIDNHFMNNTLKGSGFLRRYKKSSKNSINDLTSINRSSSKDALQIDDSSGLHNLKNGEKSVKPQDNDLLLSMSSPTAHIPPPIPSNAPPELPPNMKPRRISSTFENASLTNNGDDLVAVFSQVDDFGKMSESGTLDGSHKKEKSNVDANCSSSSSSDDDETEFQTSKIRSLQIRPVGESTVKVNASVDELRSAIGHMSLQRSSTFEKDPWLSTSANNDTSFTQSLNAGVKPMRAALTGDEHLRRKYSEYDALPPPNFDFAQTVGGSTFTANSGGGANTIARARPRSHTPTAQLMAQQSLCSSSSTVTASSNSFFHDSAQFSKAFDSKNSTSITSTPSSFAVNNNNGGSTGNLLSMTLNNDGVFTGATSSSPITFITLSNSNTGLPLLSQQKTPKLPVAMAVNEYIHAWFKGDGTAKATVRTFGTIMISLPISILGHLNDTLTAPDISPLKFSIKNALQIKSILPNQKLITSPAVFETPSDTHTFSVDRKLLGNWLSEQQKAKSSSTFHNVDVVRYELSDDALSPPLSFTAYWRTEQSQTDLRIDYRLNSSTGPAAQSPLLNIVFSTLINGDVESVNSDPEAKWTEGDSTLRWTLTELSKHGDCSGSLKARLKLRNGPSTPTNTSIQFQINDVSASKINVCLESDDHYMLSMIRRKVIAGKYFCEPQIR